MAWGFDSGAATGPRPDVHETLKRLASRPGGAGDGPPRGLVGLSDQYFVLDSWNKEPGSDTARGEFRFALMAQGATGAHVIGVRDRLANVIELEVSPFPFPLLPDAPYALRDAPASPSGTDALGFYQNNAGAPGAPPLLAAGQYPPLGPEASPPFAPWPFNPYSQLPAGGRFTLQVREVGRQGFSGAGGAFHQFEFGVAPPAPAGAGAGPPGALLASPVRPAFTFTEPLHDLPSATLVFRNPDAPLCFEPDVLYDAAVEADGSAFPGPFLRVRAPAHGLAAGDRLFLRGARTGLPALDSFLGRADGHVAAGAPGSPLPPGAPCPPDFFYLDPAVSVADVTSPLSLPAHCEAFIAKRRLRVSVRCRCVVDRVTNHIVPV